MNASANQLPSAERLATIKLLILDVDGVLTNGQLIYNEQGQESKCFHVHDGHGIKALMRSGIEVAVISGRSGGAVRTRLKELGVKHVFLGQDKKQVAFKTLTDKLSIAAEDIACVGDDEPDIAIMSAAGVGIAVANAHTSVLASTPWRTTLSGGNGAVREVCDALLAAGHASADAN